MISYRTSYKNTRKAIILTINNIYLYQLKIFLNLILKVCILLRDNQITFFLHFKDFCLDLFEPSGHGKRKRRMTGEKVDKIEERSFFPRVGRMIQKYNDSTPITKFKENIEYTVMMPDGIPLKIYP